MFDDDHMNVIRRAYARQILAVSGVESDERLEEALAVTLRERFVGAPPWRFSRPGIGYDVLPSDDPAVLYQDILIALAPDRGVNNGSPSLHARWLHILDLREGDRVAHIGAGTGYYTALIAHLVGERGHVTAVEYDRALADHAQANLAGLSNVTVVQGDGAGWPREDMDAVYVNFSVERPAEAWIERLRPGGRLIFPLGVPRPQRGPHAGHALHGAGFCITRGSDGFSARWLHPAFFVCAEGALSQPGPDREALKAAFERGGAEFVRSLTWRRPVLPQRCWFTGTCWALSYDDAG